MDLFKHMSIGRKLSLSFGILFLVVLLLGIFWQRGIVALKEIEEKKSNLIELKEKLREMEVVHYRWVDNLREVVRSKGKFEGALDPKKCIFGTWYYSYNVPYPELQELFRALEEPHKKLHEAGEAVIKALEQGNTAEAERLSLRVRQSFLPELMKVYEPFLQGIGTLYAENKIRTEKSVKRQTVVSRSIIVISLISVVFLAVVLTGSIANPLKKVTDTANRIAEGDIPEIAETSIYTESKSEIRQMESAFSRMAISLQQLTATADRIASGDLDATVKIRSDKDVLAAAISRMVENLKHSVDELHNNSMNLALGMSDYFTVISELAVGNLNVKASEDTGDDLLNQLGKVTNDMIAEFKKLEDCIEEVKNGNLDVELHIRSDKDTLGIGFRHMLEHLRDTSEELHSTSMNLAMGLTEYFMILQQVSAGDLTVNANEDTGDDLLNQLGKATNAMISSLKELTYKVREQANLLASSANSMASVTKQSTRALSELSTAISLISSAASSVAESSHGASSASQAANTSTMKGSELMQKLADKTRILQNATDRSVQAMRGLSSRSSEIGKIVNVITKIAFQTNLLSLNAAIEAARAGESGHGFAVVADEVRKLAENSANSAREIAKIIKEVQNETEEAVNSVQEGKKEMESGVFMIGEVSHQLSEIASEVQNIVRQIESIAGSAAETASSAEEASASSEEQTAAMEELSASAAQLSSTAQILRESMARFKV
ncbi:MAG: methyl-accepting chemotaxis protein [Nitrospirota bacterium]